MDCVKEFFARILDVFRGSVSRDIVRELVRLQRERALLIARTVLCDVYVYDGKAYFSTGEIRRHENVYYRFKDGHYAVLEDAIQKCVFSNSVYMRYAHDLLLQDKIGVFVPLEACFIKSQTTRDLTNAPLPLEERILGMRKFIADYDRAHPAPTPAQGPSVLTRTTTHRSV